MKNRFCVAVMAALLLVSALLSAQQKDNQFKQIDALLPSPNACRTASGSPGPAYWQQQADYRIAVELDELTKQLTGEERITYTNHSPDALSYLWVQLDQNIRKKVSLAAETRTQTLAPDMGLGRIERLHRQFDGGYQIHSVRDGQGRDLHHAIVHTMMRVDLPAPLKPGQKTTLNIEWDYPINDCNRFHGRSGYREGKADSVKTLVFTLAQFFPRMAVYDDVKGWRHRQFLGSGEFALPFGNYDVSITVPADYMVGATGRLQNSGTVLSAGQRTRLAQARKSFDRTVLIVNAEEARGNGLDSTQATKTWVYKAENVRDFAFAASRNFIWDAMAVKLETHTALAMSYYTARANPLWGRFSTKALAHGMRFYSDYTFTYPYPKAISVEAGRGGGMEYPMIAFNGGLPNEDGSYTEQQKCWLVGVIIHEFGHNFFPMIVNTDERQWGWMDEGMNSFVEYLAEEAWDPELFDGNGSAYSAIRNAENDRRRQATVNPIMMACDIDPSYFYNAYTKATAGLNILRESILGRELFDYAFKTYCNRWKFKHPQPADFFRTLEDASGMDLDWFWRGWFFGTDPVDLAIENVDYYRIRKADEALLNRRQEAYITTRRNRDAGVISVVAADTLLQDRFTAEDYTPEDVEKYGRFLDKLSDEQKSIIDADQHYYQVDVRNQGGMVMPVILRLVYEDGTETVHRIPAEVWRYGQDKVSKVFVTEKAVRHIDLDPYFETADANTDNNQWTVTGAPKKLTFGRRGRYR